MKKSILIGIIMLLVAAGSSYASGEENINKFILSTFRKQFPDAQEVKWEKLNDGARACFKLNEQMLYAYYSADSEMKAIARIIKPSQLPIHLSVALAKKYSDYYVADAFEVSADGSSSYFVVLDSPRRKLLLRAGEGDEFTPLP